MFYVLLLPLMGGDCDGNRYQGGKGSECNCGDPKMGCNVGSRVSSDLCFFPSLLPLELHF